MLAPNYQVVFTVADHGLASWKLVGFSGIFVGFGIILVITDNFMTPMMPFWKNFPGLSKAFNYVFLTISVVVFISSLVTSINNHGKFEAALRRDSASVVEGKIENFVPMPFEGHASESFTVNGKRFSYSDYTITDGFNNTSSHGGPIRAELQVRVTYVGDTIIRLEIAQ